MMFRLFWLWSGLIVCFAVVLFSGCSGSQGGGEVRAMAGSTYLSPFADSASQTPRWMDIADYLYMVSFRRTYQYPSSTVVLSWTDGVWPPTFTLSAPARALKPNFCYQMKLEGPSAPWPNPTNQVLGSNGRWWCDTCSAALSDATVDGHVGHLVKGYLYFDFAVTGADGSLHYGADLVNSYHVTWKTSQRPPVAGQDGTVRVCTVVAQKDKWAYDKAKPTVDVGLYGEWEPGRALPGQLRLPGGTYTVDLKLTEESFHSRDRNGGNWRTVMYAPGLTFEVPEETAPAGETGTH